MDRQTYEQLDNIEEKVENIEETLELIKQHLKISDPEDIEDDEVEDKEDLAF